MGRPLGESHSPRAPAFLELRGVAVKTLSGLVLGVIPF